MLKFLFIFLGSVSFLCAGNLRGSDISEVYGLKTVYGDTMRVVLQKPSQDLSGSLMEADSLVVSDYKVIGDQIIVVGSFTNWLTLGDSHLDGGDGATAAFAAVFCRLTGRLNGAIRIGGLDKVYGEALVVTARGLSVLGNADGRSFRLNLDDVQGKVLQLDSNSDAVEIVEDLNLEPSIAPRYISESSGSVMDPTGDHTSAENSGENGETGSSGSGG